MAPFAAFLLWPLRKAAVVPIALISAAAGGACWGAYELTRMSVHIIAPPPRRPRDGTAAIGVGAALGAGGAITAISRVALRPLTPPYVGEPADLSLRGLRSAAGAVRHTLVTYPYRWLVLTVFAAGSAAGVAQVFAERAYNAPRATSSGGGSVPARASATGAEPIKSTSSGDGGAPSVASVSEATLHFAVRASPPPAPVVSGADAGHDDAAALEVVYDAAEVGHSVDVAA